jgi:hypothetical protein
MNTFIIILLVLAVIATVVALVRGIVVFLKTTEADLKGEGVSQSGLRQNKMMQARVGFQALAIVLVVLLLVLAGGR